MRSHCYSILVLRGRDGPAPHRERKMSRFEALTLALQVMSLIVAVIGVVKFK